MGALRPFLLLFWANKKVARTQEITPFEAVSLPVVDIKSTNRPMQTSYLKWFVWALFRVLVQVVKV